jgi:hypothetical protein
MRQPGGHEQFAVGTQRQRVWPDARQFDLNASGRDELIDRRDKTVRAAANNFGRGVKIIGEDSLKTESNQRN